MSGYFGNYGVPQFATYGLYVSKKGSLRHVLLEETLGSAHEICEGIRMCEKRAKNVRKNVRKNV